MDGWTLLIFFGVYLLLQLWILPKLGISTCMRGACSAKKSPRRSKREQDSPTGHPDKAEVVSVRPTD
jgi:hypothetical protein